MALSFRRLLVLAALLLVAGACTSAKFVPAFNPCAPNPNKNAPIVCVSVVSGVAKPSPEPVAVYVSDKNGNPSTINWFSDRAKLRIEVEPGCMRFVHCDANGGHCVAITDPNSIKPQCKYSVWIEGETGKNDPIIEMDPCCG